jgi:molybdopterin-guanine dinucleotide biosynthesis protein A
MNPSAIILTGGQSQRMGTDKALLRIGEQTFLGLIAHKLATISDDVLIVGSLRAGYAEAIAPLPVRFVPDSFENCGPLGGLHAGLQAMRHGVGIVVACDMPLVNVALLKHMVTLLDVGGGDAVIPQDEGGWHPLHAVYRQSCATPIEQMAHARDLRVQNLIKQLNVRVIDKTEMAQFDPHSLSLKNLNTPQELEALKGLKAL